MSSFFDLILNGAMGERAQVGLNIKGVNKTTKKCCLNLLFKLQKNMDQYSPNQVLQCEECEKKWTVVWDFI